MNLHGTKFLSGFMIKSRSNNGPLLLRPRVRPAKSIQEKKVHKINLEASSSCCSTYEFVLQVRAGEGSRMIRQVERERPVTILWEKFDTDRISNLQVWFFPLEITLYLCVRWAERALSTEAIYINFSILKQYSILLRAECN